MRLSSLLALACLAGCATGNDVDGFGGHTSGGAPAGGGPTGGSGVGGATGGTSSTGGAPSGGGGAPSVGGGAAGGGTTTGPGQPGTLIFSEYVEGSGNNKAVEITNIGDEAIAADDCVINRYQNGASTPLGTALALETASLSAGASWVVCNSQFSQTSLCDQTTADLAHSGNDVVELVCGGQPVDVIGRIGEDAVWGVSPTTTQDATLRRLCSVTAGDADGSDAFDPADEWAGFPSDTFGDLGQFDCP